MYHSQLQMNGLNYTNNISPMNLLNSTPNSSNNPKSSFLSSIPTHSHRSSTHISSSVSHTTHIPLNNNHINISPMDESPDSLRTITTSNNSATNSTITPTDHSSFMPPIGVIDNLSPPITSPTIVNTNGHNPFSSNPRFRFDAPSNVANIQSIHPQSMNMKHAQAQSTAAQVLFNPSFVGRQPTPSSYQVQNHRSSPYNNRFNTVNIHTQNNIFNDNSNNNNNTQFNDNNMPLLQTDQTMNMNMNDTFNVSNNLNVNPAFEDINNTNNTNNKSNKALHLMPPNIMSINPINPLINNNNMMNTLISINPKHINHSNYGHNNSDGHRNGPKKDIYTPTNIPKLHTQTRRNNHGHGHGRGASKFGFMSTENNAIITDINSLSSLQSISIKRKALNHSPFISDISGRKMSSNASKKRRNKKKKQENGIEFIESVEWSKAHKYHQYCPFCVRDERKKHKCEFWDKLPLRETLNKIERKEYDRECKQLLQSIEDRVKKKVVFDSGVEYRRHYDTFHKKYGFKCIYSGCCKESSSWYNFVAHLTQHDRESGRPFYCNYIGCNRRSSTKHNLIKHLQGVHKWKIINKEEPKQCINKSSSSSSSSNNNNNNASSSSIHIKSESITTASPSPNYITNMYSRNINNAFNNSNNNNSNSNNYLTNDVIQEPIIVQNNYNNKMYKSEYYYNNNIIKTQPMEYTNNSTSNNIIGYSNNNHSQQSLRVSNNNIKKNCIVSPHLLTAINDHPFIDDQENDDDSVSISYFPHQINTPNKYMDILPYDHINQMHAYSPNPNPIKMQNNTI